MRQKVSAAVLLLSQNGYSWMLRPSVASVGAAAGVDVQVAVLGLVGLAVEAHQVVPHRLVAGLGDREREAGVRAFDRAAVVRASWPCTAFFAVLSVDELREGDACGASGRRRRGSVGYFCSSALVPSVSLSACCGHVLGVDHEARLLAGERVRADAVAGLEAGRRRGQAAGVGGDRAVLVGGLLGADRRERGAEGLGFVGA